MNYLCVLIPCLLFAVSSIVSVSAFIFFFALTTLLLPSDKVVVKKKLKEVLNLKMKQPFIRETSKAGYGT